LSRPNWNMPVRGSAHIHACSQWSAEPRATIHHSDPRGSLMPHRNSAPSFLSCCPSPQPPPCFSRARCESALPLDVAGNPKASPRNGLTFSSLTVKSFRRRNAKSLAANRVPRFTRRMSGANNAGSKLSAVRPRQNRRRRAVPCFDNLARWAKPPVASPLVPQAATETVPVSAPFGLSCGVRHAAVSRPVEVRP
jgi:hypothetical protein